MDYSQMLRRVIAYCVLLMVYQEDCDAVILIFVFDPRKFENAMIAILHQL